MLSIASSDISLTQHHPEWADVLRTPVLERSVGGAMSQGARAF
jgi:hypothetical protein